MTGYILALGMGGVLGLLGGGGSILSVPILVYIFKIPAALATSYSLFVVGTTSAIAAIRYRKMLNLKIAALFAIPSTIGVILSRRYVLAPMPDQINISSWVFSKDDVVMLVFGILVVVISFFMLRAKDDGYEVKVKTPTLRAMGLIILEGLVIGGLTGFVGAGGGFMIVPALTLLVGISMREAISTSLLIIAIKSLAGFFGDIHLAISINWWFLLGFTSMTIIGAFIGVKLNKNISTMVLRRAFAYLVLIVGIHILIFH